MPGAGENSNCDKGNQEIIENENIRKNISKTKGLVWLG